MAPQTKYETRKRKRKARTEALSSSDSSSEGEKSATPLPQTRSRPDDTTRSSKTGAGKEDEDSASPQPEQIQERRPIDSDKAFEEFYLKQATKEFANDIDKLRSAPDFNERHVPVLIRALKQGTACFSGEERARVGGAAR